MVYALARTNHSPERDANDCSSYSHYPITDRAETSKTGKMIMTAFKYEMIVISVLFPMSNIIEHIWDCTHYSYCSWWLPWLFWLAV